MALRTTDYLVLDIKKRTIQVVKAKQYDGGTRIVNIKVVDNDTVIDLQNYSVSAKFYTAKKRTLVQTLQAKSDKTIDLTLNKDMLYDAGLTKVEIIIFENEDVLSTIPFILDVIPSVSDDSDISEDESFNLLIEALRQTQETVDEAIAAAASLDVDQKIADALNEYTPALATEENVGVMKPDGTTVEVDEDGTLHSLGGEGGNNDYTLLLHKPRINNNVLEGNKTASELGIIDGHKILNADGVELIQRGKLKIIGATLEDDLVNNTTVLTISGGGSTVPIATLLEAGIVKPDGETITIDQDGTIHSTYSIGYATALNGGIVKVDGTTITIDENGVIHSVGGGGGSVPVATPSRLGISKPDNNTILIDANGVLRVNPNAAAGVEIDNDSITLNENDELQAVKVNGHTVETNVPANAVFTDTTDLTRMTNVLPVNKGGTGVNSLTAGEALIGNGTNGIQTRAIDNTSGGTAGSVALVTSGALYSGLSSLISTTVTDPGEGSALATGHILLVVEDT